jgi:hypothetical protein
LPAKKKEIIMDKEQIQKPVREKERASGNGKVDK